MKTSGLLSGILILILSTLSLSGWAQDDVNLQKLLTFPQDITAFNTQYPQEKVYLHFDNTSYYLSENIWFKAYVVKADRNSLSKMSQILYVDLVSAEGYIIESQKLKIENGQCNGSFKPIATNHSGFYEIRAYTSYMLNFGSKNYFSRVFPVYDKPKVQGEYNPGITQNPNSQRIPEMREPYIQKEKLKLTFYPEGGNLVTGLKSVVAFKATTSEGENAIISGLVYNQKNESVLDFNTKHLGMGSFEFTPTAEKYSARVKLNNKEYLFELPAAKENGYVMHVENGNESFHVIIHKKSIPSNENLALMITARGIVQKTLKVDFNANNLFEFSVPKTNLLSGVNQITLYNATGEVKCERLVFVENTNPLRIKLSMDKPIFQPFARVEMNFSVTNVNNNPVETTFSLSVRDAATSSSNLTDDNIHSNLLLSSELKGYIENPGYYFEPNKNHSTELNLLLLVQGWSRYSNIPGSKASFKLKYPIEKALEVNGSVSSLFRKKSKKDIDITMLLSSTGLPQLGKAKTDSAGRFGFVLSDFTGVGKLTIQTKENGKRKETYIRIKRDEVPELKAFAYAEKNQPQYFNITNDKNIISELTNENINSEFANNTNFMIDKKAYILKEVTVKEKRKPIKVSVKYDVAKELDRRRDLGEWIPDNIGVFLHFTSDYYNASTGRYKGKYVIFVRENRSPAEYDYNSSETEPIPGLRDNMSGGQMPYLDEIESISFIEDYSSITRIYNGILDPSSTVVALIRCKYDYSKEPYGVRNTTFSGYSPTMEFFSPQYDKMVLPDERDYRRTLYWNPNLKTDINGNASIHFYNNSSCKLMNISAETVTANGLIGELNK